VKVDLNLTLAKSVLERLGIEGRNPEGWWFGIIRPLLRYGYLLL